MKFEVGKNSAKTQKFEPWLHSSSRLRSSAKTVARTWVLVCLIIHVETATQEKSPYSLPQHFSLLHLLIIPSEWSHWLINAFIVFAWKKQTKSKLTVLARLEQFSLMMDSPLVKIISAVFNSTSIRPNSFWKSSKQNENKGDDRRMVGDMQSLQMIKHDLGQTPRKDTNPTERVC